MVRTILYLLSLAVVLCCSLSANAQSEKRITILYDAFRPTLVAEDGLGICRTD